METLDVEVIVPDDVLFREVDGEAVLLNIENGKYFGLDETGTRMWRLLSEHRTIGEACRRMLAEYDVEKKILEHDLLEFVEKLSSSGLLKIESG